MAFTWFVVTTVTRRLKRYSQNVPTFRATLSIKTITNGGIRTAMAEKRQGPVVRKRFSFGGFASVSTRMLLDCESSRSEHWCRGWLHCRAFYKAPATATLEG
jgi:hypothetical protein